MMRIVFFFEMETGYLLLATEQLKNTMDRCNNISMILDLSTSCLGPVLGQI